MLLSLSLNVRLSIERQKSLKALDETVATIREITATIREMRDDLK